MTLCDSKQCLLFRFDDMGFGADSCAFWNCQLEKHSLVFSCVLFRLNVVDVYLLHVLPGGKRFGWEKCAFDVNGHKIGFP